MKVIKSNTYNIVNPEPFEIPFPIVFELFTGNTLLAEYTISEAGVVDYSFNPNTSEKILTSIMRALTLNDIYFLFMSRIFPDKTPFTAMELERFELEEYHPYSIIRKTRGMLPGDKYWLRFENENINYKLALQDYRAYFERSYRKYIESLEQAVKAQEAALAEITAAEELSESDMGEPEAEVVLTQSNDVMSEDMINSLMKTLGDEAGQPEEEEASGGMMSEEDIAAMLSQTRKDNGIEEKMSDDAIAELFAHSTDEHEAEPAGGTMFEPDSGSHEKMSDDAIAALLAANMASEPEAEPEPAPEPTPEPEPEPAPASSDKMSDDAIAALLAANMASEPEAEPEPAPEPTPEPAPASSEKMSDDAIAALLAANMASEPEAEPEPAPEPTPEPTPEPAPEPAPASSEKMSDDAIAALFAQN
jgi:hypothetical protein